MCHANLTRKLHMKILYELTIEFYNAKTQAVYKFRLENVANLSGEQLA